MKRNLIALMSLLTCLLMLAACSGNTQQSTGTPQQNSPDNTPPAVDTESSSESPGEDSLPPVPMPL